MYVYIYIYICQSIFGGVYFYSIFRRPVPSDLPQVGRSVYSNSIMQIRRRGTGFKRAGRARGVDRTRRRTGDEPGPATNRAGSERTTYRPWLNERTGCRDDRQRRIWTVIRTMGDGGCGGSGPSKRAKCKHLKLKLYSPTGDRGKQNIILGDTERER